MSTYDLYQVVDEQDNLIGAKPRNEIDFEHDYYRISGLWLTNSKGQILLAQRLMTKDKDPGKWGPAAAGTLEVGETYESNMYKEAEEEIGLTGVDFALGPKMKFTAPRHSFCQWFTAVCDKPENEFVPQPSEVERVKWIDEGEFFEDVQNNPNKYLPTMSLIIEALYPDEKG